jgi:SP family xylose:H+ symportor-like MFS transporter
MNKQTFLLLITAVSALGGLLFGYDTGVINGAQFYLSKHFDLEENPKESLEFLKSFLKETS